LMKAEVIGVCVRHKTEFAAFVIVKI
jgi:hypothetical protein